MATVVVLADPPRDGLVLPDVAGSSALDPADATAVYAAFLRDAATAAANSGGDLLVNYRPDDLLPEAHRGDADEDGRETAEATVRAALAPALDDPDEVRFEPQVGSTRSARVGNTVTHLLREEGASGVVVLDPRAPLLGRTGVDEVAMKLRRSEVVVAPSTRGRVAAMAFADTLDFEGALSAPAVTRLTERALAADLDVDFRAVEPLVETGSDLATLVSLVRARADAGRTRPAFTAGTIEELDLRPAAADDGVTVRAGTDSS